MCLGNAIFKKLGDYMAFLDFLFGSKDKMKKVETMSPEQKQFMSQILAQLSGQGGLGQGYGQALGILQQFLSPESDTFKNFEQPHLQEFQNKTLPGIAERFAGAGGGMGGALSSSGFGQALGSAGSDLQTNLAAMKSQLQQGALQNILGQYNAMSGMTLGAQPFGYQKQQGSPGLVGQLGGGLLGGWAQGGFKNPFI
jgi:hypothetical protein